MKPALFIILATLTLSACAPHAPVRDRAIGGWQVMVSHAGKPDMLCYAGEVPFQSSGSLTRREAKPYLMATRRASGKVEISASAGYDFMPAGKVELALDEDNYSLFFKGATAWARSDADDREIIDSLKTAAVVELRAVSKEGLTSVDRYNTEGFIGALARLKELCP